MFLKDILKELFDEKVHFEKKVLVSEYKIVYEPYTLQSLYNTPHYITDLDITLPSCFTMNFAKEI